MMLFKAKICHDVLRKFMNDSVLMNWSILNKTTLILVLGSLDHLLFLGWYILCYKSNDWKKSINLDYFVFNITILTLFTGLFFLFIFICYFLKHRKWIQLYFPYIALYFFAFAYLYSGYNIGIISPATIAGYISIITVGLILFERKIVYSILIPVTLIIIFLGLKSTFGHFAYAPIYSDDLNQSVLYTNEFWVFSQIYFYIPIFIVTLLLYEILIIQWRNREDQINNISYIDPLTGINNRRKIGKFLKDMHTECTEFSVILLDLDHFKRINDDYGHDMGDRVLQKVAMILSKNIHVNDLVGRFGGEEFIIILKEKSLDEAINFAELCRLQIENQLFYDMNKSKIYCTASFGVSISNQDLSIEYILKQADRALYFAKQNGRNQVRHSLELIDTLNPNKWV